MTPLRTALYSAVTAVAVLAVAPSVTFAAGAEKSTMEEVKDYTIDRKNDFVAWQKRQMRALDEQITKLEDKMNTTGKQAGKEWTEARKELERARKAAARSVDAAGKATKETWNKAKAEAAEAVDDAKKAYNAALEKAKTDN